MLRQVRRKYLPRKVVALLDPRDRAIRDASRAMPLLANRPMVDNRPTAYVCENFACREPVTDAGAFEAMLQTEQRRMHHDSEDDDGSPEQAD
jgi:uncharacterized protein YyaL (SSP411 family)